MALVQVPSVSASSTRAWQQTVTRQGELNQFPVNFDSSAAEDETGIKCKRSFPSTAASSTKWSERNARERAPIATASAAPYDHPTREFLQSEH